MKQNNAWYNSAAWCAAFVLTGWLGVGVAQEIAAGWFKAGSDPKDYDMGSDSSVVLDDKPSGYIRSSKPDAKGFGTYMQMFDASDYLGKRVRFSAMVKTEDVQNWASLWMRVDGENKAIAFDNMQNRSLKGTQTWTRSAVVLDVDAKLAKRIAFGIMLAGKGAMWVNNVKFETVGEDVPVTDMTKNSPPSLPKKPANLDFGPR